MEHNSPATNKPYIESYFPEDSVASVTPQAQDSDKAASPISYITQPPYFQNHVVILLSPSAVTPPPNTQANRFEIITRIVQQVLKTLRQIWKYVTNPIDPDWRKNQKYHHILVQVAKAFKPSEMGYVLTPGAKKGSKLECRQLIYRALKALDGTTPFETERDRYVAFATSLEQALDNSWYKSLFKNSDSSRSALQEIEAKHGEVADLHNMAFALFTQVNTQGFTLSVAKDMAKLGNFEGLPHSPAEMAAQFEQLNSEDQKKALLENLDSYIDLVPAASKSIKKANPEHKIAYSTFIASKIKGGFSFFDFAPLTTGGNPTNIKYSLKCTNPETGTESNITCLRMASPTVGAKISPLFKGYLRALKSRGLNHTYINLQDRRTPWYQDTFSKQLSEQLGHQNEYLRSRSLEALNNDPEFKKVIQVYTLDKNSHFYQQKPNKKAAKALLGALDLEPTEKKAYEKRLSAKHEAPKAIQELINKYLATHEKLPDFIHNQLMKDTKQFRIEFLNKILDPEGSFHMNPEDTENIGNDRISIRRLIKKVGKECFKEVLSPLDRQNFIEIVYIFWIDYLIHGSDFFNTSCKDCIDRGEGENWLKLGISLLREIVSFDKTRDRAELELLIQKLQDLIHKMDEDALWARKREIIDERLFRSVEALKHLIRIAANNPEGFLDLCNKAFHLDSQELILKTLPDQQVQGLQQNNKDMKQALDKVSLKGKEKDNGESPDTTDSVSKKRITPISMSTAEKLTQELLKTEGLIIDSGSLIGVGARAAGILDGDRKGKEQ